MCQILLLALRSIALNLTNDIYVYAIKSVPIPANRKLSFCTRAEALALRETLRKIISTIVFKKGLQHL